MVSSPVPGARSIAFGLYFPTGSRDETRDSNGISHFLEHLLFKGTPSRSVDQINREIDSLGGASNAFTSKEVLCFHARVLAEHLTRLMGLFGDLASNALGEGVPDLEEEVHRERAVILQEILAVEDSPEDLVDQLADHSFFGDHPLALPVVGSVAAVTRLELPQLRRHLRRHLGARKMIVAASGAVEHEELVARVREDFEGLEPGDAPSKSPPAEHCPLSRFAERDIEQVHVALSAPGLPQADPDREAAELLSMVYGEGVSSRLFREVRERRGLAYSIGSSLTSYCDSGSFNVSFAVAPSKLDETLEVVSGVLRSGRDGELLESELEVAKQHYRAGLVLAHDSPGGRMAHIASQALAGIDDLGIDGTLAAVERVTLDDLSRLAKRFLGRPLSLAAVGPVRTLAALGDGWEIGP
ncbi:MAG: insulinase family protein [Myxococcales bacterium]|nr:insulinase family protein [Myxococcales bacterium]